MTSNFIDETWKRLMFKVGETLSVESLERFASSVSKVSTALDSEGKLLLVLHGDSDSLDFIKPFFSHAIEFGFGGLMWQSVSNESDYLIVLPPEDATNCRIDPTTNNQFITAIEQLIAACRSTAAANPKTADVWLERAEALESLIESEADPVILTAELRKNRNDSNRK